jgi:hypothetical protein
MKNKFAAYTLKELRAQKRSVEGHIAGFARIAAFLTASQTKYLERKCKELLAIEREIQRRKKEAKNV